MFMNKQILLLTSFFILLTGCINKETVISKVVEQKPIINKKVIEPIIIEKVKEPIIKKIKITKKKKKIDKKKNVYKYCKKHIRIMNHASAYIEKEFKEGYFLQKDLIGAKAQLFLIKSKSPSIFSKNINTASESYEEQYKLAKKNKCDLKKYKFSPIVKVQIKIKTLEKEALKNGKGKNSK